MFSRSLSGPRAPAPLFTVSQIRDGYAEVLDEQRNVQISEGSFNDSFAGYGVHLYRIPMDQHG
jgi:hypothetical protein